MFSPVYLSCHCFDKMKSSNKLKYPIGVLYLLASLAFGSHSWSADNTFKDAVRSNNLAIINKLIETTDDLDQRGTNGKTALMLAAKAGDNALVKKLLEAGADSNAVNINGGTPIMFAAMSGDIGTLNSLIDAGVNISARGSNGWSALMVSSSKGYAEATRMILNAGADVNTTDVYLWTPLHRAVYENEIAVIEVLLEQNSLDIHRQDEHGATALHHAAANGNAEIVEMLIAKGANPTTEDFTGRIPATYALNSGHQSLALLLGQSG
jgi:ankyrin repeat protein